MANNPRYLGALAATALAAIFTACAVSPKAEHTRAGRARIPVSGGRARRGRRQL